MSPPSNALIRKDTHYIRLVSDWNLHSDTKKFRINFRRRKSRFGDHDMGHDDSGWSLKTFTLLFRNTTCSNNKHSPWKIPKYGHPLLARSASRTVLVYWSISFSSCNPVEHLAPKVIYWGLKILFVRKTLASEGGRNL